MRYLNNGNKSIPLFVVSKLTINAWFENIIHLRRMRPRILATATGLFTFRIMPENLF